MIHKMMHNKLTAELFEKKVMLIPFLMVAMASVLWSLDAILRRNLFAMEPLVIVFFEHLIGAIFLVSFGYKYLKNIKITKKIALLTLLVSTLSGIIGTLAFIKALMAVNFIPFSVVLLLQKLQPIFAIGTAKIWLKEKLNSQYWIWATLAMISAYFITFPFDFHTKKFTISALSDHNTTLAMSLALLASFAWGVSTNISKKLIQETSAFQASLLRFSSTSALSLIVIIFFGYSLSMPNASQLLSLTAIALSTGMVALWLYYQGLSKIKVSSATIIELIFPASAILIDFYLYNTTLATSQLLAVGFLIFAISGFTRSQTQSS